VKSVALRLAWTFSISFEIVADYNHPRPTLALKFPSQNDGYWVVHPSNPEAIVDYEGSRLDADHSIGGPFWALTHF
jgi:hypothetical protein